MSKTSSNPIADFQAMFARMKATGQWDAMTAEQKQEFVDTWQPYLDRIAETMKSIAAIDQNIAKAKSMVRAVGKTTASVFVRDEQIASSPETAPHANDCFRSVHDLLRG